MDVDPAVSAAGFRHIAYDIVGSTNAEALALARAGDRGPVGITARAQNAGRGRRERKWVSEPGNLYATLLLVDPAPSERAPQLSFVAALAVHDAVRETATVLGPRLSFKWPNDVLCDRAKISGILVEGEGVKHALAVALGIGIDCAHHPGETDYPATDLAAAGAAVTPQAVFRALSKAMLLRLTQWNRGAGFAAVRADWLERAAGIGKGIRVRLADRELAGRFEGIDQAGHLMLRRGDGAMEMITSGDVFPIAAGPAPDSPAERR